MADINKKNENKDRLNPVYDVVKIGYSDTIQTILDKANLILEREMIICEEDTSLYIKLNGKLYKTKLEEVV